MKNNNKALTLSYEEWYKLHEAKSIVVSRGNFEIVIEIDRYGQYVITVISPYETVKCNTVRP